MVRIMITGNAGSGKTTFSKRVGALLDLPVFGLDRIGWQPGWQRSPRDWRSARMAELLARPAWVVDGVSSEILDAADIVVFLDVGRATSYWRVAKRNWRYLFSGRPELPENCPEILIIPTLMKIIWNFQPNVRPGILAALEARQGSNYIASTAAELDAVFSALAILRQEKLTGG